MTTLVDSLPVIPILDLSLQTCAKELNCSHNDICTLAGRVNPNIEVVAFKIIDDYKVELSPQSPLFSFNEGPPLSVTFRTPDAKRAFDRYKSLAYTFISKARLYDSYVFPDLYISSVEKTARERAWGSLSVTFTERYYTSCEEKVERLALEKCEEVALPHSSFDVNILDDNSIVFGAKRQCQGSPRPFISLIPSDHISDSDLTVLNAYRLNKYIAAGLYSFPKSHATRLLEACDARIKTFLKEACFHENPSYELLPENEIRTPQEIIKVSSEEHIKMLADHQTNVLSCALVGKEHLPETISKELADANLKKHLEAIDSILLSLLEPLGIFELKHVEDLHLFADGNLQIAFLKDRETYCHLFNLTKEQKADFFLYRAYAKIAQSKIPPGILMLNTLYQIGARLSAGLFSAEGNSSDN
jgi:hypothetical protein